MRTLGAFPAHSGRWMRSRSKHAFISVAQRLRLVLLKPQGAKRFARYEWAKARAYLEKAKEEQAYSDFAASRDYAKKAAILAEIAKKKAKVEMRIDGSRPMVEESNP